jgi:apolipoprotein D and lipocalin family protein
MRVWILPFLFSVLGAAPPEVVTQVDLARYMGTWHEIAKFPNRFQRGCGCTTANYTLRPDGKVSVLNRCRTADGTTRTAKGWAKVVDANTRAKLKVTFFWPFFGDYWILALDPGYRHVLVGTPDRKYLWILAREPRMEADTYEVLVAKAREQGFDTARLVRTNPCEGL